MTEITTTNITKKYLKLKFKDYYSQLKTLNTPEKINQREWGFIPFNQNNNEISMKRHMYFENENKYNEYIVNSTPAHIFYSVAYYEKPFSYEMENKIWTGADLVFDLDGDHLSNYKNKYSEMLFQVKKETLKLISFLEEDFGFKEEQLEIIFSGGRGYHIHVYDSKAKLMKSSERREIVDYITGKGLKLKYYIKEISNNKTKKYKLDKYNSNWGKRISSYFVQCLKDELVKQKKYQFKKLKDLKLFSTHSINKLLNIASKDEFYKCIVQNGQLDFPIKNFENLIENFICENKELLISNFGCNIDEPVTCDIKRLIRFPGSLHGGTGLKVIKIPITKFEYFDPLIDAVVFGSNPVKVNIIKPYNFEIAGKEYVVSEETEYLPEYAAIYLMCKGIANYGFK